MSNTTPTSAPTGQNANQRVAPLLAAIDLRDYFAAKAMQAHITANFQALAAQYANYPYVINRTIAKAAYETADAMLKARGQA